MKRLVKDVYFKVFDQGRLSEYRLHLGYILHVERVYDLSVFELLVRFCREYRQLTGVKAICAVMSGANPLVRDGMKRHAVDDDEFARRLRQLAEHAALGYHGHYWHNAEDFGLVESEMHCNSFAVAPLRAQMEQDLQWFKAHDVEHNGIYTGGWWFMNDHLFELLAQNGFSIDYSFSKSPWFRNQYSHALLIQHRIRAGEPFYKSTSGGRFLCIQTLIGCHDTDQVLEFDRRLLRLLEPGERRVVGVLSAHDYDLMPRQTLRCVGHLQSERKAVFHGAADLVVEAQSTQLQRV